MLGREREKMETTPWLRLLPRIFPQNAAALTSQIALSPRLRRAEIEMQPFNMKLYKAQQVALQLHCIAVSWHSAKPAVALQYTLMRVYLPSFF